MQPGIGARALMIDSIPPAIDRNPEKSPTYRKAAMMPPAICELTLSTASVFAP
jgi:hypothetical protein